MPKNATAKADPRAQSFLGREFLTWLWFRCETDGGTFNLAPEKPASGKKKTKSEQEEEAFQSEVGVVFNDYVALISDGEEKETSIMRKGSAHRSAEARTALLVGKLVDAAKLEIARGDRSWKATIAGETLDIRSAKFPEPEEGEPEERTLERLSAMQELGEIMDGLYGLFLSVRTRRAWDDAEVPAMQKWIRKRAGAREAS